LPRDFTFSELGVVEAIRKRRSIREYSGEPMSMRELSYLLKYSVGRTEEQDGLRAAPSAGSLYPLETYPVVNLVEGLDAGIYQYLVNSHSLRVIRKGDFRQELIRYALDQEFVGQANLILVLTAIFQRGEWKYRQRARRYMILEAGHIGQNVYLVATSLGLGTCAVGAYWDDDYNHLIGVDGKKESVIYLLTVGKTCAPIK